MNNVYQFVRVFDKANEAQGNLAAIFYDPSESELLELVEVSTGIEKKYNIATTCFIKHFIDEQYTVRCFNADNEIQCCGHGMIAAAKTIFFELDISKVVINGNVIVSSGSKEKDNNHIALKLPRIPSTPQALPYWVGDSITFEGKNLIPSSSAVSAENDGYELFEFEPVLALDVFSALQLDLKQVCENTKRAVVLIQFDREKKYLYMRYFAPQYGVLEDSATGSVMRFVADYIEQKYQCTHFDVSQCSSQGGFMKVDCNEEKITIIANATIEI